MRVFNGFGQVEINRPTWGGDVLYGSTYAARVYDAVTKKSVANANAYLQLMTSATGAVTLAKTTTNDDGGAIVELSDEAMAKAKAAPPGNLKWYVIAKGYKAGYAPIDDPTTQATVDVPMVALGMNLASMTVPLLVIGAVVAIIAGVSLMKK